MSNVSTMEKNGLQWWQEKEKLDIVKKTVSAKPLTDIQFTYFLELCKQHGLNPFLKQVTAIPQGEKVTAFVTIDGLWTIAHRSGRLNGFESGHRQDGNEIVGYCKIFVKDFEYPVYTEVYLSEFHKHGYNGKKSVWDTMPRYMIKKVAEAHALRRAFPEYIGGLYSEEEKWEVDEKELIDVTPKKEHQKDLPEKSHKKSKPLEEKTEDELRAAIEKDLAYLEYDEIEDAILNTKCVTLLEIAQVTRKLAMRKYRKEPNWLASEFFNVSRDKYVIQAEDNQEELEFQDEIPY